MYWNWKKINIINSGLYKIKSSDLKKYIPQINNNNNQNEYYLTDIIELMVNDNINIDTYQIETKDNKLITGVNTKEELEELLKFNTAIDYSYFDLKEDGFKRDHLYCDWNNKFIDCFKLIELYTWTTLLKYPVNFPVK